MAEKPPKFIRCLLCELDLVPLEKGSYYRRGMVAFCEACYTRTFVPPGADGEEYVQKLFKKEGK